MDEWILLERLKEGDETAFREIVETWQNMVFNTALGIVQNEQDAEDVAQEVFIQVHQSIHTFKGESKFSTWLYRITITKSLDHERRKKRKKRAGSMLSLFGLKGEETVDLPEFNHPGVQLDNKEKAGILFKAIAQLPQNQRVAFTLNKVEGLSYQQVSEIMESSVASIESLLHRAKSNLKRTLEDYYKNQ